MRKTGLWAAVMAAGMVMSSGVGAQQFEAVFSLQGISPGEAKAAIDDFHTDPGMKDGRVTLYAAEFGVGQGTLKIVADYDNYEEYTERRTKRLASHGWSRMQLAMQDVEFVARELVGVIADYGKPRHTANYLLVYLLNVHDAAKYQAALKEMNDSLDNPGVLRLVAIRTGDRAATHAVLIGGDSFASVHEFMDKLYASDAFRTFSSKVSKIRSVVRIETYRKLGAWGY